jgi:hypothetical protein
MQPSMHQRCVAGAWGSKLGERADAQLSGPTAEQSSADAQGAVQYPPGRERSQR